MQTKILRVVGKVVHGSELIEVVRDETPVFRIAT